MPIPTYDQFIEPLLRFLARYLEGVSKGVFITTSAFTQQAMEFVQSVERLVLIDGERLTALMIEHGVGVSHRVVKVPKAQGMDSVDDG
jgi:restriction endonuclease Mrr